MKNVYRLLSGREKIFFPGIFILCLLVSQSFAQPASVIQWQKCYGGSDWDWTAEHAAVIQTLDSGFAIFGTTVSSDGNVSFNHGIRDYWLVKTDAAGNILWQKTYGGSLDDWSGSSVLQTADSGYIFIGYTFSNDGDVSGNHGLSDIWVVKTDASGNLQWQKCYGGSNYDQGYSITETHDSGYLISGIVSSNDGDISGNHGGPDIWIAKIDSLGNIVWQKCLGGTNYEGLWSPIRRTLDNGFILPGNTRSNDGDVSGDHGSYDGWVVKLDSAGNIQWQKCLGGSSEEFLYSVVQANDSGYLALVITASTDGDVVGNHSVLPNHDAWVVKLNSAGNIQWSKCYGGTQDEWSGDILAESNGNIIFTCGSTYSTDGDVTELHGNGDAWLVCTDSIGNLRWQKCLGGSDWETLGSIIRANDGTLVLTGYTSSNDGDISGNHGLGDIWIVKYNMTSWISGTVYVDSNQNCIQDPGEQGEAANRWVTLNPSAFSIQTNSSGNYTFYVDPGSYTVTLGPSPMYNVNCPASGSLSVNIPSLNTGSSNNNFADTVSAYCPDLSISIGTWALRPCLQNTYSVTCCNNGTLDSFHDSVVIVFPSTIIPLSSTIPWTMVAPNTFAFIIDTLLIGQCTTFNIVDSVSCSQSVGDTLCVLGSVTTLAECYTGDNTDLDCRITTNSCDPNSKEVTNSPVTSWVSSGNIFNTDTLQYQINFQNTGTDTAFTVSIYDSLSSYLDITSIENGASSHPCSFAIYPPAILVWTFNNISLLDSNVNEALSHGFVQFKIRQKPGNAAGTQIINSASIVFDYNSTMLTNTTICTVIDTATGIDELKNPVRAIYPNPAMNFIAFDSPILLPGSRIVINDAYGKIVTARKISSNTFDISRLAQGVYFVKITTHDGNIQVFRFIKE